MISGVLILLFGITWFSFSTRNQEAAQVYTATINRDCAPWDGAAFAMSFRYGSITTITISIWQLPSFTFPVTFSFPHETIRIGIAHSLPELDPLEEGIPAEGEFNFMTENGKISKGSSSQSGDNQIVMCG